MAISSTSRRWSSDASWGLYIATLFVVWQIINLVVFRTPPGLPVWVGGTLVVAGGLIVTFWR